jgi:DNA-binding Lrp family transcriptional regulator
MNNKGVRTMTNNFLAINKDYFRIGLKSIDILIIAQVEEFQRNKCECYITNKQLSEMFGESESTIKRTIDKLEDMQILKRKTSFVEGNGRGTKMRTLAVNPRLKWKVQNELSELMEGSKVDDGRFKNDEWKVQNEPIKEKKKDNKKDNITEASSENDYSFKIDDGVKEKFYKEERERLGEGAIFEETEDYVKSYLGEKPMGMYIKNAFFEDILEDEAI